MKSDSPFPPGSLVAAYFRDSGGKKQELSIEQQEQVFRQWCAENGLVSGKTFADVARSGGSVAGREQFNQLIQYFESRPKEAGVVFFDYSRFARDFDDSSFFLSGLRRKGYTAYSMENYVPSGSTGKVVEALYLWSAEEYRHQLSTNVKRGRNHMIVSRHAWLNPLPPVGYKLEPIEGGQHRDGSARVNNRLVPDPLTAPRVRMAFELAAGGASLAEIMRAVGFYQWSRSFQYLLANPIYKGVYDRGGLRVDGFCEPIVDRVLWERVQMVRGKVKARQDYNHPRSSTSSWLLSGMVYCARCGRKMDGRLVGARGSHRYRYYACIYLAENILKGACPGGGVVKEKLEADVLARLEDVLNNPTVLQAAYDAYKSQEAARDDAASLVAGKRLQLAELDTQLGRISDAIARRPGSMALLDKLDELEKGRAEVLGSLAVLEAQPAKLTLQSLEELRLELVSRLKEADFREKQLILRSLGTRVSVERTAPRKRGNPYQGDVEWDFGGGVKVKMSLGIQAE